jgi:hypothetical protein
MVFMLRNETAKQVESLVYETVLIGKDGNLQLLTLFHFRDAPWALCVSGNSTFPVGNATGSGRSCSMM